jgi:4-hydroxybenzoate polyprenyltransferase
MTANGFTDIPQTGWVQNLPERIRPFALLARLDRPIGTWLLLFPCWWSLALAHSFDVDWYVLFGIGALAMRSAGCTLNDIWDRNLDGAVERTRGRPLPSGQVSLIEALLFFVVLCLIGLGVAVSLGWLAVRLSIGIMALVVTYPLMKRITWWPQLFLGLAFNWGALVGWAVATDSVALPAFLLYAAGICWTLGYDTIYAHQDKADDAELGIKSTARLWGVDSPRWIAGFYAAAVLLIVAAGFVAEHGWAVVAAGGLAGLVFLWQVATVDLDDQQNCLTRFKSNGLVGWIVLVGLLATW